MLGRQEAREESCMLAEDVLTGVRDTCVIGWMWLSDFLKGSHRGEHPHAQRSGAYIIGVFDSLPKCVDMSSPNIIYIGESNGPGVNLYVRLHAFALSAGLQARGVFRHSGGERFAERVKQKGNLAVALIPFVGGPRRHPDWRGIAPALAEKLLLAAFLECHHNQPILNEDGRHVQYDWFPELGVTSINHWAINGFTESSADTAIQWLQTACSGRRLPDIIWKGISDESWQGLHANVHKRNWNIYLGQYDSNGPLVLEVWVGDIEHLRAQITTPDMARQQAWVLQYRLRNGWQEERF